MASDPNIAHADVDEIFEALENGELSVSSCAALDLGQIRNSVSFLKSNSLSSIFSLDPLTDSAYFVNLPLKSLTKNGK